MRTFTKVMVAAAAITGSTLAVAGSAQAQAGDYAGDPGYGGYYGPDPNADPYADPYYAEPYDSGYADPYACDYYEPPWGYPPDYCAYQVWQEPIYVGGLWYSGPIYYRSYDGDRQYWLNGGWRRDEWRGSRPGRIDWSRNMRWNGPAQHRGFNGGGAWNGRTANRGGNFGGGFNRGGDVRGREFGGRSFAAPQNGGQGVVRGRFGAGGFQGRTGGEGQAFVQPGVAPNNSGLRGRFGGQAFQAGGGPRAGGGTAFQGGGNRSGGQGGGNRGGGQAGGHGGGERGQGHRGH
jgi:hypothetical protein